MSRRESKRRTLNSDIDVTPFVDVMLVLLIIFMITSPMLISGVDVNLPEAKTKSMNTENKPITISINKKRDIFIEDANIQLDQLANTLTAIMEQKNKSKIFIRGDKDVDYGLVLQVFADIKQAGFEDVGLITNNNNIALKKSK